MGDIVLYRLASGSSPLYLFLQTREVPHALLDIGETFKGREEGRFVAVAWSAQPNTSC